MTRTSDRHTDRQTHTQTDTQTDIDLLPVHCSFSEKG